MKEVTDMDEAVEQAIIVDLDVADENQATGRIAFFNSEGVKHPVFLAVNILPIVVDSPADDVEKIVYHYEPIDNSLVLLKFTEGNVATNADVIFEGGEGTPLRIRIFNLASLSDPPEEEDVYVEANQSVLFFCGGGNLWALRVYYLDSIPEWTPQQGG